MHGSTKHRNALRSMPRRFGLAAGLLAVLALATPAIPSWAQSSADAQLSAVSFLPLKPGSTVRVRLLDDSESNLAIKKRFENALAAQGFTLDTDATLVLTFETREDIGSFSVNEQRTILRLRAEGGREGGEDASAMLNVFNSQSGGLLNEGTQPGTQITAQSVYRIDATVDDKSNGRRIWEGWSVAPLSHSGPSALIEAMVPALAAHVGKSATQITVPVY